MKKGKERKFEAKRSNVPRVIQLRRRSARNQNPDSLISIFKLLNSMLFSLTIH